MNLNLTLNSTTVGAVLGICLIAAGGFSYWYMTQPETWQGDKEIFVQRARAGLEKPVREKLRAEGLSTEAIEDRIERMWDSGELKLPEGEPGVHWFTDPNGNVQIIPSADDLLKGARTPRSPGAAAADRPAAR